MRGMATLARIPSVQRLQASVRAMQRIPLLLLEADARRSLVLFAAQTVQVLIPLGQLWVAKLIIDRLVTALRMPHPAAATGSILRLVALELALAVLNIVLREIVNAQRQILGERVIGYVSTQILAHAQQLDLQSLERPAFYDHLRRIEEGSFYRPASLLYQLLTALQGTVTLLAAGIVLARLQPLALPFLLLAAIPYAIVHSRSAIQLYTLSTGQTAQTREARYLSHLLSTDAGAKEVRVYGLGDYLLTRYRAILRGQEQAVARLSRRCAMHSALASLLPAAVYASILTYLALSVLNGDASIGDVTLYVGLILRSQDALQQTMVNLSHIVENSLFLDDYYAFLRLRPETVLRTGAGRISLPIRWGIRFESVSYSYSGAEHAALSDVTLDLRAGETVAIVGENGAGKTTLVKLLSRLYDPESGRVTVDGQDLRTLDVEAWQRQIAVIFQDFLQYYLTVRENIGFGQVELLHDRERVAGAARRTGVDGMIDRLPQAYETMLGRWFAGGVQLSGGEWQRIALARALMRDAPILVLDEPTAALDARTEFETFSRLRDIARGRIVLLISHRFSTVRLADRIFVMHAGRLVEEGTHEDLLRCGGRYAELFQLQAASYR